MQHLSPGYLGEHPGLSLADFTLLNAHPLVAMQASDQGKILSFHLKSYFSICSTALKCLTAFKLVK